MTTDPGEALTAAPARVPWTRSRAGNAMGRTRVALLDGALRAVEKYGVRRMTMADVASVSGIAKGTVYNHFRTKDDVLTAAVAAAIDDLGATCEQLARSEGLSTALAHAASTVTHHAALRRAAEEPAALAAIVSIGSGPAWERARAAVARVLAAGGSGRQETADGVSEAPAAGADAAPAPAATPSSSPTPMSTPMPVRALTPAPPLARGDSADAAVAAVLRWLVGYAASPARPGELPGAAEALAVGLASWRGHSFGG